jgi:hypothetical protein
LSNSTFCLSAPGLRRAAACGGGAPEAVQVADRWHLLRNLGDALTSVFDRHHRAIRAAAKVATALLTARRRSLSILNGCFQQTYIV